MLRYVAHKRFVAVLLIGLLTLLAFPAAAQIAGEVELVGTVDAMTVNTITVNSQIIDVSTAEINTTAQIGTVVRVEGTLNPDGSISAREVNAAEPGFQPGEAEIIGILENVTGNTLRVSGQTIDFTNAEFQQGVTVGVRVKVHATATGNNTWIAREVAPAVADDSVANGTNAVVEGEFEITGTLDQVTAGFIVVSGQTIAITNAEINTTLVAGTVVKVHVSLVGGVLVAREVESAALADDNANSNGNANQNNNLNDNTDDNGNDNSNSNANSNSNSNANGNDNSTVETAITEQAAINIVLGIYPNTTITRIELDDKFDGVLVWEVRTSHGLELNIDAQTGVILTIERRGDDDNSNNNANSNRNSNNNEDNFNGNGNSNTNSNSNEDNSNSGSGMGSGDEDEDNSGMGSGEDEDGSGMG